MTYKDILNEFADYCEYNPDQTNFNLLSQNYELHKIGKLTEKILTEYDPSGELAVIYVKEAFKKLLSNYEQNVLELLLNPAVLDPEIQTWKLFHLDIVAQAEQKFIAGINSLFARITKKQLIGDAQALRESVLNQVGPTLHGLDSLKGELYLKGGPLKPVNYIDTKIHVFETLTQCLLHMEGLADGLYLNFINVGGTADCYFGIFIKNNGNLLAFHDRQDETYRGQHAHARNGRWSEAKADSIFPYNYLFSFTGHDAKGYATKYEIQQGQLDYLELGEEISLPIILAMIMMVKRLNHVEMDLPIKYVDLLLTLPNTHPGTDLICLSGSQIAKQHKELNTCFDQQKLVDGSYTLEFTADADQAVSNDNDANLLIKLWANNFTFDTAKALQTNSVNLLLGRSTFTPEFVGSKKRIRKQLYRDLRQQLAEHIRDQIYLEWKAFGGTKAVVTWYSCALMQNLPALFTMALEELSTNETKKAIKYLAFQDGQTHISTKKETCDIYFDHGPYSKHHPSILLNKDSYGYYTENKLCMINHKKCNFWVSFEPKSWQQIEAMTGKEVPKIVKGWSLVSGRHTSLDAVTGVGTPFERNESASNKRYEADNPLCFHPGSPAFDFSFAIGFSKSGWNQLIKTEKAKVS